VKPPKHPNNNNADADAEQIAQYYDANTRNFLRFGGAGDTAAIHRAIWAPGISDSNEAFQYLNRLVAEAISPLLNNNADQKHLLDLGCGVGGSAIFLAKQLNVIVTGITISETQCQLAQVQAEKENLTQQLSFIKADFGNLPPLPPIDAAYAIESFVHSRDPAALFSMIASRLPVGGRLIICDDFVQENPGALARYWVERFKRGWHLNSILSVEHTCALAEAAGFCLVKQHALSPYLRQFPEPLLWLVTHLTRIPLPWAYWDNLAGGTALQRCVQRGWTEYNALVWEKI